MNTGAGNFFDRYLEPVASQFDLTFPEIRLLLYLSHLKQPVSRRELSDYTNMTRRSLSLHLQKLMAKGYIRIQESREKKTQDRRITVWMLPEAAQVKKHLLMYSGSTMRPATRVSVRMNCCNMHI